MRNFYLPDFVRCPICSSSLTRESGSLCCGGERRHTYDISKEGYVNLLPPGRAKNARTGDGADMIRSRERFLSGGGYDRYSREAAEFAAQFFDTNGLVCGDYVKPHEAQNASAETHMPSPSPVVLIDAGCGEGRHTVNMSEAFARALELPVTSVGFDASKFGVQAAAKKYLRVGGVSDNIKCAFFAGNIFSLPVTDGCADVFTSLFAPLPEDEARRTVRRGGLLVICAAGAEHLCEMRELLYDDPIPSGGGAAVPDGFSTVGVKMIEYSLELKSNEEIMSLFTMTPFYHNAPITGKAKLESKASLTVTVQVKCTVAKRV